MQVRKTSANPSVSPAPKVGDCSMGFLRKEPAPPEDSFTRRQLLEDLHSTWDCFTEFRPLEFCEIFTIYKARNPAYNLTQDRLIFPGWRRRRHSQHKSMNYKQGVLMPAGILRKPHCVVPFYIADSDLFSLHQSPPLRMTLLTVGSLGISGLGLLYGISAFGIL